MDINYLLNELKKGGTILIKQKNKGKFTEYCGGKVTQSCINKAKNSGNSILKKRAVFAENARKWKHQEGGIFKLNKLQEGGNIFANYEPLDVELKDDLYSWFSTNPFDYTYRVHLPTQNTSKSEDTEKDKEPNESDYKIVYKDYENKSKSSNNLVKKTFDYFINKGLTKELASGLVGNFLAESGLKTNAINREELNAGLKGYGRGIAQWSNNRVNDFIKFSGIKPEEATLDLLLDFVWHELSQRPVLMSKLKKANTSDESAELIYRGYENGSNTALATPQLLISTYTPAWSKLGLKRYDYNSELNARRLKSKNALNLYI